MAYVPAVLRFPFPSSLQPWPLNDDIPMAATVLALVDTPANIVAHRLTLSEQLQFPLVPTVVPKLPVNATRGFVSGVPAGIHLVNLFVRNGGVEGDLDAVTAPAGSSSQLVVRLHHAIESGEGGGPVNVDLAALFVNGTVSNVVEKTLTLQWDKATHVRQQWPTQELSAGGWGGVGDGGVWLVDWWMLG